MTTAPGPRARLAAVVLAMTCVSASTASAQYFGRSKVQYRNFDFQILKTAHFDIYFYPSEREGADIAARLAERWHVRLAKLFGHELRGRQPLVLYASHPDFEQTNTTPGELGEGTGGFTEPVRRRIVLPLAGPLADTDHVIGHELVHAFQFDITTRSGASRGETGANQLPLWFIEGMAEYLTLGPVDSHTAMWLRDAVRHDVDGARKDDRLPTLTDLDNPKYFPYRWGHAFWAYVGGRWGDDVIGEMLRVAGATGDPEVAIVRLLGVSKQEFSDEWHAAIHRDYDPIVASTLPPNEAGRLTIKGAELGGDLNVGPAISPDGRLISFLSERSLFSIDLFVAEVATGKIIHRLTNTAANAHYSSLQFIYSAGAWDAESKRIAVATVTGGAPALAIFNAQSGDKEREVRVEGVDEIFNPTWAPDGRSIAFTGMRRGLTDLYVFDFGTSTLRPLTNDPFADIQPAWSPDGRHIAFATDRFTSDLDVLQIGNYRLALIDPVTGQIQRIDGPPVGKTINPQWSPDSSTLYFISDRDGVPNLYRVGVAGGMNQLTALATGISGITGSSPALSVASRTGLAAYTIYDRGSYHIYTRNVSDARPVPDNVGGEGSSTARAAATLPPLERVSSDVVATLADAREGLPPVQIYEVEPYKSRLMLDGIAQPFIGVGADRFGAAFSGGLALSFSDLLGNHTLSTAFQVQAGLGGNYSFKNTAAQVMYMNRTHRWNWGLVGGQVPYISGGYQRTLGQIGNQPAIIDETILFRQTDRSASAILAYPLDRARRVEFQAGATQMSFDQIVQTQAYSYNTGQLIFEDSQESSLARTLSLGTTSVAYVHDTSSFGATSPVQGQRYRFEAAPTFGSLNYTSMLADYRRYFMPVSFYTIAVRGMHYGRYGPSGQDELLFPLFLGYPSLVHGYDVNTFDPDDCVPNLSSDCPQYDQLVGSRLLVGNVEFRFPLLRPFGASSRMYGPIPVEVALFADAGVAWDRGRETRQLFRDTRSGVSSTGVALRANLMGFAIGELAFSRPWQRPGKGWVFQFNLAPGF